MKKLNCIVEAGRVDSNGDQVVLSGLNFGFPGEEIPVTHNFGKDIIGTAQLKIVPDGLQAEISLPEEVKMVGWPAIGGIVYNDSIKQEGKVRQIGRMLLTSVSICSTPNADPTIPSIEI